MDIEESVNLREKALVIICQCFLLYSNIEMMVNTAVTHLDLSKGSIPIVGSSSNNNGGSWSRARANETRLL